MHMLSWCFISLFAGSGGKLSQLLLPWGIAQKRKIERRGENKGGFMWAFYISETCFICCAFCVVLKLTAHKVKEIYHAPIV
jgi:hypothetical protein